MTRVMRLSVAGTVLTVGMIGLAAPSASAHDPAEHFIQHWNLGQNGHDIDWAFTPSVPSGNARDRMLDAANHWNNLSGGRELNKVGNYSAFQYDNPQTDCANLDPEQNGIHYASIDGNSSGGGTYATTYLCVYQSHNDWLFARNVKVDSAEDWSNSDLDPGSDLDLEGVITHEFGHVLGYSGNNINEAHFSDNADICNAGISENQTMCRYVSYGTASYYERSLEDHDKHTFNAEY